MDEEEDTGDGSGGRSERGCQKRGRAAGGVLPMVGETSVRARVAA